MSFFKGFYSANSAQNKANNLAQKTSFSAEIQRKTSNSQTVNHQKLSAWDCCHNVSKICYSLEANICSLFSTIPLHFSIAITHSHIFLSSMTTEQSYFGLTS
jgi:hypothetical protein